jgi:hypothetical protein
MEDEVGSSYQSAEFILCLAQPIPFLRGARICLGARRKSLFFAVIPRLRAIFRCPDGAPRTRGMPLHFRHLVNPMKLRSAPKALTQESRCAICFPAEWPPPRCATAPIIAICGSRHHLGSGVSGYRGHRDTEAPADTSISCGTRNFRVLSRRHE